MIAVIIFAILFIIGIACIIIAFKTDKPESPNILSERCAVIGAILLLVGMHGTWISIILTFVI